MGSLFGRARAAAGNDETLRRVVEQAHLRCGGPTAAQLLETGAPDTHFCWLVPMHWLDDML